MKVNHVFVVTIASRQVFVPNPSPGLSPASSASASASASPRDAREWIRRIMYQADTSGGMRFGGGR